MLDKYETDKIKTAKYNNFQDFNMAIEKLDYRREDILGMTCEITKEVYSDMLEALPPIIVPKISGFFLGEMLTGMITYHFYEENGKHFSSVEELPKDVYSKWLMNQ